MRGFIFAFIGGAFITFQGVFNSKISEDIGTWQTASITQLTGFLTTLLLLMITRDTTWRKVKKVKPLYLAGGSFGAIIIFSNVTAINRIGVTLTVSALLISQLCLTFFIDQNGWFDYVKQKIQFHQIIGIGMMIIGVIILRF